MQISAMDGSPSIYRELLALAKSYTLVDMVKCINIDESSTFISFLDEHGWDPYVDQYEMITCFDCQTKRAERGLFQKSE